MLKQQLKNEILEAKQDLRKAMENKNYSECYYIEHYIGKREMELLQFEEFENDLIKYGV